MQIWTANRLRKYYGNKFYVSELPLSYIKFVYLIFILNKHDGNKKKCCRKGTSNLPSHYIYSKHLSLFHINMIANQGEKMLQKKYIYELPSSHYSYSKLIHYRQKN